MRRYALAAAALVPLLAGVFAVVNFASPAAAVSRGNVDGTVSWNGAPVTGLAAKSNAGGLDLRAVKPGAPITVRQVDPDTGQYHLNLEIGLYTVELRNSDLVLHSFIVDVQENITTIVNIDLTPTTGQVTGQVFSAGAPLANGFLRQSAPANFWLYGADSAGNFVMLVPGGAQTVDVYTPTNQFVGTCSFTVVNAGSLATSVCELATGPAPTPTMVPGLPDLRIGDVTIGYQYTLCAADGGAFGLRVPIANYGDTAAGPFVVNANGDEQTVPGLDPNTGLSLLFPNYVFPGVNTVNVDPTSVIAESNESNNTFSQAVALPTQLPNCTPTTTPTPSATPTITPTPCPGDNNTDRNLIDHSPPKLYDDITVANSDTQCDNDDTDDDNDGIADADELSGAACSATITNPLIADTDGDRALDGAECALLTDPTDGTANEPSMAQCIAATSSGTPDNDGVLGWREYCYYNTNHTAMNTDGDSRGDGSPLNDGCEVYSINLNHFVNVVDLQQIATEQSTYGPPPGDYPNNAAYRLKVNFDVTKNGAINIADLQQAATAIAICG